MNKTIRRFFKSTAYSLNGLRFAANHEFSFRCEILLAGIAGIMAVFLSRKLFDVVHLMTPIIMAMAFELCNTAIEKIVDEFGEGQIKNTFKIIKDCASAAVFLMVLWGIVTWGLYFLESLSFSSLKSFTKA